MCCVSVFIYCLGCFVTICERSLSAADACPICNACRISAGRALIETAPPSPFAIHRLDDQIAVGIDADIGGDLEGAAGDGLGVEIGIGERAGGGEGVIAA